MNILDLRQERIDELSALIAARMPPRRLEVTESGDVLSGAAMDIARAYERASDDQRAAFDALAKACAK